MFRIERTADGVPARVGAGGVKWYGDGAPVMLATREAAEAMAEYIAAAVKPRGGMRIVPTVDEGGGPLVVRLADRRDPVRTTGYLRFDRQGVWEAKRERATAFGTAAAADGARRAALLAMTGPERRNRLITGAFDGHTLGEAVTAAMEPERETAERWAGPGLLKRNWLISSPNVIGTALCERNPGLHDALKDEFRELEARGVGAIAVEEECWANWVAVTNLGGS